MNSKLNQRKKELNLTNEKLSELSGVPIGTLSKITAGIIKNPTLTTLKQITTALNMTLDELLDDNVSIQQNTELNGYDSLSDEGKKKVSEYIDMLLLWEKNNL